MNFKIQFFTWKKQYKTFYCNIDTLRLFCKEWTPYTHSLIIHNPKTKNIRHFVLQGNYTNYYLFKSGDLSVKVYKYKRNDVPATNLFKADKGGIVNNFLEAAIQDMEDSMEYEYSYHYL